MPETSVAAVGKGSGAKELFDEDSEGLQDESKCVEVPGQKMRKLVLDVCEGRGSRRQTEVKDLSSHFRSFPSSPTSSVHLLPTARPLSMPPRGSS